MATVVATWIVLREIYAMHTLITIALVVTAGLITGAATAAPSAETAKRCIRYSYIAYPYKRPGSVRMSGDRQAYLKDCMMKDGNVPEPSSAKP